MDILLFVITILVFACLYCGTKVLKLLYRGVKPGEDIAWTSHNGTAFRMSYHRMMVRTGILGGAFGALVYIIVYLLWIAGVLSW